MFLLLWIVFHCIDVTHFVFYQICCFQPLFLQKKFFFSTQYSFFSDGTAVIPFGIVPQVPEALTSWKHCCLSLSVIHSANYFLILVIYSSVDSHTAISRFLFFFFYSKNVVCVKILVQVSLGTCVRLSLWQLPIHRIVKVCLAHFFFHRCCPKWSYQFTLLPAVCKSLPAPYPLQHFVLSGFLFFYLYDGCEMKSCLLNHVFWFWMRLYI